MNLWGWLEEICGLLEGIEGEGYNGALCNYSHESSKHKTTAALFVENRLRKKL